MRLGGHVNLPHLRFSFLIKASAVFKNVDQQVDRLNLSGLGGAIKTVYRTENGNKGSDLLALNQAPR